MASNITPETSLKIIGESLQPVVRELACSALVRRLRDNWSDDELEEAASQLVLELMARGFSLIPKLDYDELVLSARKVGGQ